MQIEAPFPILGVDEGAAYARQPARTCPEAVNVRAFDESLSRNRGGQRPGLARLHDDQINGDNPVDFLAAPVALLVGDPTIGAGKGSDDFAYSNGAVHSLTDWNSYQTNASFPVAAAFNLVTGQYHIINTVDASNAEVSSGALICNAGSGAGSGRVSEYVAQAGDIPFVITIRAAIAATNGSAGCRVGFAVGLDGAKTQSYQRIMVVKPPAITSGAIASGSLGRVAIYKGDDTNALDYRAFDFASYGALPGTTATIRMFVTSTSIYVTLNDSVIAHANVNNRDVTGKNVGVLLQNVISTTSFTTADDFSLDDAVGADRVRQTVVIAGSNGVLKRVRSSGAIDDITNGTYEGSFLRGVDAAGSGGQMPEDASNRYIYCVDGTGYKKLWLDLMSFQDWTALAGDLPGVGSSDTLDYATLIGNYRNRIVLSGRESEPGNVYMSAVGDPLDWNYSGGNATDALVFASTVGLTPDIVTALMPFEDDLMFIGGQRSLHLLRGDPGYDGVLDNVTRDTGVRGPEAWCREPEGALLFLGDEGLYIASPGGGKPVCVSSKRLDRFFRSIDWSAIDARLAYSTRHFGVHIFLAPTDGTAGVHLFYDKRDGGFWFDEFAVNCGPRSAVYGREVGALSSMLVGGNDGRVRRFVETAKNDDGVAIDSRLTLAAIAPSAGERVTLRRIEAVLGENTDSLDWEVRTSDSAEHALTREAAASGTWNGGGRASPAIRRISGGALSVRLRNSRMDETWAMETLSMAVEQTARTRRRVSRA